MYELTNAERSNGLQGKRPRASQGRDTSRSMREMLFFRMLLEDDTRSAETATTGAGSLASFTVPAWLNVAVSA